MGKSPNPYYLIRIIPAEGAFTKAELFRCFFAGSSIRDDLIFLEENRMKNENTRRLVESALMIAIGTVLSELKVGGLWAFGGGVTIGSMVPLVLISHRWGIKWGTFTAFVYSLLQLIPILIDGSTFSLRLSAHHFAFKLTSVTGDARA